MLTATSDIKHQEEATRLAPEPYVELFKFTPDYLQPNVFIAFTNHPTITWQGITYENFPHQFSGYNIQSTGEQSRPKLQVANPNGLFSALLVEGNLPRQGETLRGVKLRQSQLIRYLVLRDDLLADDNRYLRNKWLLAKTVNLTKDSVSFELRSVLDGVRYTLPARQYISPDFPVTSMG